MSFVSSPARARRVPAFLACAALGLSVLAGCAGSTSATPPAGNPGDARWDQREWVVTALGSRDLPADGPRPTLAVSDGVAHGTDGCNRYRRPLQPASDVPGALRFAEKGGVTTRMACLAAAEITANDWNAAMSATRSVRAEFGRLTLIDESGGVVARLVPLPPTVPAPK